MKLFSLREIAKSLINTEKKFRILTFSFKKLINTGSIHKIFQEKNFMRNMYYLNLIYLSSYFPFAQKTIFIVTKNFTNFD